MRGESTQRSALDPETLIADLREVGLARLRDADELWLILDGSDLRKPHAREMEALQSVRALPGGRDEKVRHGVKSFAGNRVDMESTRTG